MTAGFVSVTFILCSICYSTLLRFLVKNRSNNNEAIKREFKLYIQMLGLFTAFAILLIYHVVLMMISFERNDGPVFTMRIIFPLVTAFMSYINIWLMFILNADIRRKILSLVFRQSKQISTAKVITVKLTHSSELKRF
ncbi:hypothetical protein DICVIV_06693 [Dictyocaulus viviparus]|uniref:Uncharacterized protein n=1 Tax=Dictyocaulus viviparus TaxID=29172 RepID=A0A0D8XU19_DICVI|nr:hypothetical protein DICVIV_06693 [Dictyocaulus viviparus]